MLRCFCDLSGLSCCDWADPSIVLFMNVFMYFLQGNIRELPQRTHRWNIVLLKEKTVSGFEPDKAVHFEGDPAAVERWFGPIPLFQQRYIATQRVDRRFTQP